MHQPRPPLSGVTGNGVTKMTTLTQTPLTQTQDTAQSSARTGLLPIMAAALVGVTLIYFAGFAKASVYHDSAHDSRHTLAFPCH